MKLIRLQKELDQWAAGICPSWREKLSGLSKLISAALETTAHAAMAKELDSRTPYDGPKITASLGKEHAEIDAKLALMAARMATEAPDQDLSDLLLQISASLTSLALQVMA